MARFKGLSETISEVVDRATANLGVPAASPFSVQFGTNLPYDTTPNVPKGVFRWGMSAWGVDRISGSTTSGDTDDGVVSV